MRTNTVGYKQTEAHRLNAAATRWREFCKRGHLLAETRCYKPSGQKYCMECQRMSNEQRASHPPYLLRRYGLTADDFTQMLEAQGGRCAICGTSEFQGQGKSAHVDHDHITGKVRGLLCHHCNTALGAFGDSPEILLEAITYLREHS